MAALSSAFDSSIATDEDSLRPSRAAPPVPSVGYHTVQQARRPDIDDLHQFPVPPQLPREPKHFSRPSTQQTAQSQPHTADRGRSQHGAQPSVASTADTQPRKRSASFSLFKRSSSKPPQDRVAQVQQANAAIAQQRYSNGSVDGSATSGSTGNGLFRAKSKDKSDRNMLRKQSKLKAQQAAEIERQRHAAATRVAPQLPEIPVVGDYAYTDPQAPPAIPSPANYSRPSMSVEVPTFAGRIPASAVPPTNPDSFDRADERVTSMTNRGRYSYASSTVGNVNSPRRVRRRKDPTPFNVLVIGTKNSGKTSFISFLRNSLALKSDRQDPTMPVQSGPKSSFSSQYLETEIDGERVGVTLWDSAGFEKNLVDLQLREMLAFIESKFEDTFNEEQRVVRSPGFRDTHIHCVFLVLDPIRLDTNVSTASAAGIANGGLDAEVDLQVLKSLWGKTTVIPVVSKADTLTTSHMNFLKRAVWQSIKSAKLNPLDALELDDDDLDEEDEDAEDDDDEPVFKRPNHNRQSSLGSNASDEDPYIPMSILSPDPYSMPPYTKYPPKSQAEIGRRYAWGFASPFDPNHCDFIRLKDLVFSEWRADLRELSRVKWYEQWRTSRLRNAPQLAKSRGASVSQGIPIRDTASRSEARNFSAPRAAPRTQINTQGVSSQPAPVGMAVTTPGGMNQY